MFFTYTIGLLAAAGILIPLIIHLWNVKEGKTLKIGSIAFLGESSSQQSKSLKVKDWLLFLLRSLLIIVLAFLLAGPYVLKQLKSNDNGGWILVEKAKLAKVYQNNQKQIDSLLSKGFEIHDLGVGFDLLTLNDTLKTEKINHNLTLASLIKQLNHELPSGYKVVVFTEPKLTSFTNEIIPTALDIEFHSTNQQEISKQKITEAYYSTKDSIKILLMNTNSQNTNYQLLNYTPLNSNLEMKTEQGVSFVKWKNQDNWVKVEDKVLEISVYAKAIEEEKYLMAALNAIQSYTQRKINIRKGISNISTSDWVFWLSDAPIPSAVQLKDGARIFKYLPGKPIAVQSFLKVNSFDETSPKIYQSITSGNKNAQKIWTDGFGNAILSLEKKDNHFQYNFASRLNPQWSDLVWNESFVKVLMPLILSNQQDEDFGFKPDADDQRLVEKPNNLFTPTTENSKASLSKVEVPFNNWLWFFAFLIFLSERLLTYQKTKK